MEGNAAGGRGGHGGASGGRGKNKKSRARAKSAAASAAAAAASAAAAAAALTASAKQSGGKKAAAVDGSTTATTSKIKALKAVKAVKTASNAGNPAANPAAGGVTTRLTRKKLAGAKSATKLKMGTVAAAAAVAAAAPSAPTVQKKRAATKKQQHEGAAVVSVAPVDAAAHEHHAASTPEQAVSGALDAVAKSTVVPLTEGKRARGKKRRAGSLGASDHESPGSVATAEASAPTPTPVPATTAQETSAHLPHPHHIVHLNKHSSGGETPTRIAFLGGPAARDSAGQDTPTGSTNNTAGPHVSTPRSEGLKTTASPTARAVGAKKLKVAKKGSVRVKTVGNVSGASDKVQVTKAQAASKASTATKAEVATRPEKEKMERQLESQVTNTDAAICSSAPAIAAIGERTISTTWSPALTTAPGDIVTRSQSADTSTTGVNGVVTKRESSAASNVGPDAVVAARDKGEAPRTPSKLNVAASLVIAPTDVQQEASALSQPLQQQQRRNNASHQADTALEQQRAQTIDATEVTAPTLASLSTPAQPHVPSKLLGVASTGRAGEDRSNVQSAENIKTSTKLSPLVPPSPVSEVKISVVKEDELSQVTSKSTPAHHEHEAGTDASQHEQQNGTGAVDAPRANETSLPSISRAPAVIELREQHTPVPVVPPPSTLAVAAQPAPPSLPHVKIPEPSPADKESHGGEDNGDGVTSPATLAVRRIFSGEMKRLQAVHFQRLSGISEHPASETKAKSTTSKKRRREDENADTETAQRQETFTQRSAATPTAPAPKKEAMHLGIIMDSHAYVAKMMRSDPVTEPTPVAEAPVQRQAPVALPSNTWGASFGLSGGGPVSAPPALSSPVSPLASTRPLSSWFLSKGAANFVKRVSFKGDASGFGSAGSSKRRRISTVAEGDISSSTGSRDGEGEENPFLASLASHTAWRSWYTTEGKTPADSLLDPIPTARLPRELLDHPVVPMVLGDDGDPSDPPNNSTTGAPDTAGASTTTAPGRASELERLEQEIRAEKRRARAFERMLLLVLQGKAASGREFEDEYGPVLAHERSSRPGK